MAQKPQIEAGVFVRTAWEVKKAGGKIEDLAKKLDRPVNSIHSRLSGLRKKNVKLPEFEQEKRGRSLDIDSLNDIAAEFETA